MTSDPIDRLLDEHRVLRHELDHLRGAVDALAASGEGALAATRPVLQATSDVLARDLVAHARREDEALFPALEAALGAGGPTGPFRDEHGRIRAAADTFHAAVERGDVGSVVAAGGEILQLLDDHFAKEESMLFPTARDVLDTRALAAVTAAMERLDRD